jgi:hypothetical protein
VNVGKANAPTDGRLPSQHIVSHTGLNNHYARDQWMPALLFDNRFKIGQPAHVQNAAKPP